ncbi:FAD/NAD(P)-dependent oxidoreductase [Rhizobium laguerreae]|uniref:FAD/NAD(P)-dependent oxidoreductase n=1 Tax=Rhizobium laguerreae TaxID=1076926 RepID=UPI001C90F3C5|nr:NAD(P)/FAD-dependent oxidoreductase [Rhizobium laguerreae]MBY3348416.1 FAD-dependent oxidoreductase [Rhizobium laguerreae]MBY3355433.1 FAD-dependent oxidoreductase [Rhizobium laguerreae]MBY3369252.1 FAD-dependent oxidoreductase [Rhizobium laguerreae]MBY3376570.1 FAD-dependent oxidoreductase [Rhizobium laguerreae]MBY3390391.1 FAD-dependent oxidoreductase [Rhizobium laguerreae]
MKIDGNCSPPVIVGAGPAGLAAAETFLQAGIAPLILDEADSVGGQGTRRLGPLSEPRMQALFGPHYAARMKDRQSFEDSILARTDYRPLTTIWGVYNKRLEIHAGDRLSNLPFQHLLLCTGATDRILPVPGWTLPGVYTLGGAQVALKKHGTFIGRKIVFAGSSPLLYLAAAQYLRLGACDLVIIDSTSLSEKMKAAPAMARWSAGTFVEGLRLLNELKLAGVRMIFGADLLEIGGSTKVEHITFQRRGHRAETVPCDAVAIGHGLRPETQLAELAGAKFEFDAEHGQWFPATDMDGRAAADVWIAGDAARTVGAVGAKVSGALAALSVLREMGITLFPAGRINSMRKQLKSWRNFQHAMARAFIAPAAAAAEAPGTMILCRCERVTAADIREAVAQTAGPAEINRVKAITRCGMGRCQGRYCGFALQSLLSSLTDKGAANVGRLRAQAPVRPIPLTAAKNGANDGQI